MVIPDRLALTAACLVLAGMVGPLTGYPNGAPDSVCDTMTPNADAHGAFPQNSSSPYSIILSNTSYSDGSKINVTIRGPDTFRGFFLQARKAYAPEQADLFGSFSPVSLSRVACQQYQSRALTHSSRDDKAELTTTWTAPTQSAGDLVIIATVVQNKTTFWVRQQSVVMKDENKHGNEITTAAATTSTHNGATTPEPMPPIDLSTCGKSKGCFRSPSQCPTEEKCDRLVTWADKGDHVDFELSGFAKGWVALGFSLDEKMASTSVTDCVLDGDKVKVEMSWNVAGDYANVVLQPDAHVSLLNMQAAIADGRISCRFTRMKLCAFPLSKGQTYNLTRNFYLMLGNGTANKGVKAAHDQIPLISPQMVNLSANEDIGGIKSLHYPLIKIHGCLMLIAVFFASCGMFIARFFKKQWTESKICGKNTWFFLHRGCMLMAVGMMIAGFITIFLHVKGYSQLSSYPDKAHPPVGIATMVLFLINPLMAFCRPSPDAPDRYLFNWLHFGVGNAGLILAVANIFIGLILENAVTPWWTRYVVVAWIGLYWSFFVAMEIIARPRQAGDGEASDQELLEPAQDTHKRDRKMLTALMGAYEILAIGACILLIVMVARGL